MIGYDETARTQFEAGTTRRALLRLAGHESHLSVDAATFEVEDVLVCNLATIIDAQATQVAITSLRFEPGLGDSISFCQMQCRWVEHFDQQFTVFFDFDRAGPNNKPFFDRIRARSDEPSSLALYYFHCAEAARAVRLELLVVAERRYICPGLSGHIE
jgi:hypothetical protein